MCHLCPLSGQLTASLRRATCICMDGQRTPQQSQALLAGESRLREGPVTAELEGVLVPRGQHLLAGDAFLLHADCGSRFRYQRGEGVTVQRADGSDLDAEELWLNGSVYAAVACLNGFLPLHASAVAHEGRVYAFTGPAGAGKSTLAAGLGRLGLPLFCDDTLLIDLSARGQPVCMPGHKRLKLRPDALVLTDAVAVAPVGADSGKSYARPAAGAVSDPLPLAALIFLHDGDEFDWTAIAGGQRLVRLEQAADHHTWNLFMAAARPSRAEIFALWGWIASSIEMAQLTRPRLAPSFDTTLAGVARRIRGQEHSK